MVREKLLGDEDMLEYEKKVLVTEDEYIAIINMMCKDSLPKRQINYYFDTDDLSMNRRGITCRIREKNGLFQTTIKKHNVQNPECSVEENLAVETTLNSAVFEKMGLTCQGELITGRTTVYKDSFCEVVIDCNAYLGYTDYELEIEYGRISSCYAYAILENIANMLVVARILTDKKEFLGRVGCGGNKSQRFFERKTKEEVSNAIGIK